MPHPKFSLDGFRDLGAKVLDQLYPSWCVLCENELSGGRSICDSCHDLLPPITAPFCQVCSEPFQGKIDGEFKCPNCADLKFAFDFARSGMMRDPQTLEIIHRLKYGREIHLASELARLAAQAFLDPRFELSLAEKWPLIPVPLHYRRMQHRHFNQAAEIGRSLAKLADLPLLFALKRVRNTTTQTLLSRKQRLDNLRGAFALTKSGSKWLSKQRSGAILIDDILTTGSTVDACAKQLRRAGFSHVHVVTVMRG